MEEALIVIDMQKGLAQVVDYQNVRQRINQRIEAYRQRQLPSSLYSIRIMN